MVSLDVTMGPNESPVGTQHAVVRAAVYFAQLMELTLPDMTNFVVAYDEGLSTGAGLPDDELDLVTRLKERCAAVVEAGVATHDRVSQELLSFMNNAIPLVHEIEQLSQEVRSRHAANPSFSTPQVAAVNEFVVDVVATILDVPDLFR